MSVAYPGLFQEKVLPLLEEHFKEEAYTVYIAEEDRTAWYFKNKLVCLSEGKQLGLGLVWIDDIKIKTEMSMNISLWQQTAHNEMIRRERAAAERIWKKYYQPRNNDE